MGIFPDAQGQLTSESLVRPGQISNSSEILWLSSLPAKLKKTKFFRRSSAANSAVPGPIWPNFELVRTLMIVLITYIPVIMKKIR